MYRSRLARLALVAGASSSFFLACASPVAPPHEAPSIAAPIALDLPRAQGLTPSAGAPAPLQAPPPEPPRPTEHFTLDDEVGRPIEVYPPIDATNKSPFVVVLHATCMEPAWVCDWFGSAGRDSGWLVCPSGNGTCNAEPDWEGQPSEKASFLERDIDRIAERIGPYVSEDRAGVLFGWSRGAFAARDILYASTSDPKLAALSRRFRGLVLMAAKVSPDVKALRAAGIERVVMAAGDYDASSGAMSDSVAFLKRAGIEARFVSLGKIAHVWPKDFEERMREPIAWAAGG
jgi:hypothetical protein